MKIAEECIAARCENDTARLITLSRAWRRRPRSERPPLAITRRLALVSGATTQTYAPLLELASAARGIELEIFQGTFSGCVQDVADPSSALYAFQPQIIHLAPGPYSFVNTPDVGTESADVETAVACEGRRWLELAQAAQQRSGATVVLDNFPEPPFDPLGGSAGATPSSLTSFTRGVNAWLATHVPLGVVIHDVWKLAGEHGTRAWLDTRAWVHGKQPLSPELMGAYVQSLAAVVAALSGRTARVLVLDLDGTLWGGVVGDDGLDGIRLGEGSPEGESFKAFQHYCRALSRRGIIVAVCSKNDEAIARLPFEQHPECVLKLEHFSAFRANWDDKVKNLVALASELNLGLDTFVFCDDNPVERAAVQDLLPAVTVVPMPEDPADYVRALASARAFDTVAVRPEDLSRTESYRASQMLRRDTISSADLESFLRDLRTEAAVRRFNPVDLPRAAELVAKSNQFNLTTRRHSLAALQAFAEAVGAVTFSVRLRDRLADHGLISVVVAVPAEEGVLEVDTWVMSCRVLKRGVEAFTRNYLCLAARKAGYRTIRGVYRPSARNGLVQSLYRDLGFQTTGVNADGSIWELDLETASELPHHILHSGHE